jgi:hypothetical protein
MGEGDASDGIQLAELVDCKLLFVDPNNVIIYSSRFTRCTIELKKQCREHDWPQCNFTDCTFIGRFFSCNFGMEGPDLSDVEGYGTYIVKPNVETHMANCDFSRCDVHLCSFFNCDPATIKFPAWPHITVIDPIQNAHDWMKIPFPKSFRPTQYTVAHNGSTKVASIVNWKTYARKAGEPLELSTELREILKSKSYIKF